MAEITDQLDGILDGVRTQIDQQMEVESEGPLEELFEEDEESYDYDSDYETDSSLDEELQLINAQLQWEESLVQLQKLFSFIVLPLLGKLIGRRFAGYSEFDVHTSIVHSFVY